MEWRPSNSTFAVMFTAAASSCWPPGCSRDKRPTSARREAASRRYTSSASCNNDGREGSHLHARLLFFLSDYSCATQALTDIVLLLLTQPPMGEGKPLTQGMSPE